MSERPTQPLLLVAAAVERLEKPVVVILTAATGFYTYRGMSAIELNSDLLTKAGCALFAISITAGLYLFWQALLSQVPMLSHQRRWLAIPIIILLAVFTCGVSSFFNLAGLVGLEAVRHHMEVALADFSDALAAARNQAHEGLTGASAIKLNLAKFQDMSAAERVKGGTSGVTGSGAITGILDQVTSVMAAAVADATAKEKLADKLAAEAENSLNTMRTVLADPTSSLPAKTARFTSEAEALRLKLLQLSRLEIMSTVRGAVAAARETVKPTLSANAAIAARQQQTIEDLTQRLSELESLNQVAAQPLPLVMLGKPFQSITVYTAVLAHLGDYIPAALAVLFVDLLLLPLLGLKCLVENQKRSADPRNVASCYTVAELIEMRRLMEELGLPFPARQAVELNPYPAPESSRHRGPVLRLIPTHLD